MKKYSIYSIYLSICILHEPKLVLPAIFLINANVVKHHCADEEGVERRCLNVRQRHELICHKTGRCLRHDTLRHCNQRKRLAKLLYLFELGTVFSVLALMAFYSFEYMTIYRCIRCIFKTTCVLYSCLAI